jgi:flagellar protein FliJ
MKARDAALRLRRFDAADKARKVEDLESMIRDFEQMASDLDRQIAIEEDRTGIKDVAHFSYSTFAKAAATRRANLIASVDDLRLKLDLAKNAHAEAVAELQQIETADVRDVVDRGSRRKAERNTAMHG